jgi:hypothetical protein
MEEGASRLSFCGRAEALPFRRNRASLGIEM